MKYLINKLANTKLAIILRNTFKIKPAYFYNSKNLQNSSISDSFCWRTDNGYKTKFKFSDILNLFFEVDNSWGEIEFFDRMCHVLKLSPLHTFVRDMLQHELHLN